jgi:hypothetical protein
MFQRLLFGEGVGVVRRALQKLLKDVKLNKTNFVLIIQDEITFGDF